jgi:hypothetical protein
MSIELLRLITPAGFIAFVDPRAVAALVPLEDELTAIMLKGQQEMITIPMTTTSLANLLLSCDDGSLLHNGD